MNDRAPRPSRDTARPMPWTLPRQDPAALVRSGARRVAGHVLMLGSLGFVSLFTFVQAVSRLFR